MTREGTRAEMFPFLYQSMFCVNGRLGIIFIPHSQTGDMPGYVSVCDTVSGHAEWLLKLLSPAQLGLLDCCIHEMLLRFPLTGTTNEHKHFGKPSVNALRVSL